MSKWREFWILKADIEHQGLDEEPERIHLFEHLVEHGALIEAEFKIEVLEKRCDEYLNDSVKTIRELQAEVLESEDRIAKLTETLTLLASHEPSWSDDFCRAKAALAELSKAQGET